ncbi:RHS domain-containing protein [bacterium]|nr:RHS domain-containing protein [bacterium]
MVQDSKVYHFHLDHLGTPQEMTNQSGHIVWSASFTAYGNLAMAHINEIDNPLRFQGQYFDQETGLHYNRHRYYDPSTASFVTADPIGLKGGINNYRYVPNPVSWV